MGQVFEAEQAQPRRRVALKTIHPWLVSERTRAWLRREADALGTLLHPNIPQVYELGEADGVLFVAMERVEGAPLAEAVRGLSVAERVRLVAEIGDAVVYAHGRGFIHRDLKPANVLVTAAGRPKVLDFGLAAPADRDADDVVVGTVAYLAPEQLAGPAPPDVRADVYALGVLLFEVLRGDLPIRVEGLRLREVQAQLHTLARTPLDAGRPDLAGDLRSIVERATAHEPARRYLSASALVEDLRRYLDHQPVRARGGGALYVASRWVRRNPLLVSTLSAIALGLVAVSTLASWSAIQANSAAAEQRRLRGLAEQAQLEATRAQDRAEHAQRSAEARADFLEEVFTKANPRSGGGRTTLWDATDAAIEALDGGSLSEDPEAEAAMRVTLAEALLHQGKQAVSHEQLLKTVAAYDAGTIQPSATVVDSLHGLSVLERLYGEDMEASETAIVRGIAMADELGLQSQLVELLHTQASVYLDSGRVHEASPRFSRALAIKEELVAAGDLPRTALTNTRGQVAQTQLWTGDNEAASRLYEIDLAERIEHHGPEHPRTGEAYRHLAWAQLDRGEGAAARSSMARGVAILEAGYPVDGPAVRDVRQEYAQILLFEGDLAEADRVLTQAAMDRYGSLDPQASNLWLLIEFAELRARQGRAQEARALSDACVSKMQHRSADLQARAQLGRGNALSWLGAHEEALADLKPAMAYLLPRYGPGHPDVRRGERAVERSESR